jgi:protein-disulfide isomerase
LSDGATDREAAALLVPAVKLRVDHVRGSAVAPATVLEFGDYECPYSRAAYRGIQIAERRLGDRLRFAFRQFPLTSIHPHAASAATAAEAAALSGRFWSMHDALFGHQDALDPDDLLRYAVDLGIDERDFAESMVDSRVAGKVRADVESGIRSGVHGTPTLFVNGVRYEGSYRADELVSALREIPGAEL